MKQGIGNWELGNYDGGKGKGIEQRELSDINSLTLSRSLSRSCGCPIPYSLFPIPELENLYEAHPWRRTRLGVGKSP
jgi:hypothetical protein